MRWPIRVNDYLLDVAMALAGPVVSLMAIPIGFHIRGSEPLGVYFDWNPDNIVYFVLVTILGIVLSMGYVTWWFVLLGRGQTPGK